MLQRKPTRIELKLEDKSEVCQRTTARQKKPPQALSDHPRLLLPWLNAVRDFAGGATASGTAGSCTGGRQGAPFAAVRGAPRRLRSAADCSPAFCDSHLLASFSHSRTTPTPVGSDQEAHRSAAHRPRAAVSAAGAAASTGGADSQAATPAASTASAGDTMEVEVKLRLADANAHAKLAAALRPGYRTTHQQVW